MDFLICTNNPHKLKELKRILRELGVDAYSPREFNISLDDVEENGATFEENAIIKAKAGLLKSNLPSIADDSGLCIDALDGRPGIFSARYGGGGLPDREKSNLILRELDGVIENDRTARFKCAIAIAFKNGDILTAEGTCDGKIGFTPTGENGFGYDPIFYIGDKSFAEFSSEEKDRYSHRGNALKAIKEILSKYLKENTEVKSIC